MDVIELQRILNDYLHYLKAERGLSENTVSSYGLDLQQFINYLSEHKITDLNDVDKQVIVDYLDYLMNKGKANASIIRCVTSLRKFFQSMKQDEKIQDDPMISIETPKGEKHLPEVLSIEEVEMLLNAPDTSQTLGIRNRAILELMYATGLRVSEVVNLKLEDLHLDVGIIRPWEKDEKNESFRLETRQSSGLTTTSTMPDPSFAKTSAVHPVRQFSWRTSDTTRNMEKPQKRGQEGRNLQERHASYFAAFFCNPIFLKTAPIRESFKNFWDIRIFRQRRFIRIFLRNAV